MTKKTVSSLWGDFDEVEDEVQETGEEEQIPEVEVEKDEVEPEKSGEPKEETETKVEKEEPESTDADPLAKTFDEIAEALEGRGIIIP